MKFACSPCVEVCFLQFPPHQNMHIGLSPVNTLDRGPGSESGVGPLVWHCGCPLLLRDGFNTETKSSLYAVYVTNKVPLPLLMFCCNSVRHIITNLSNCLYLSSSFCHLFINLPSCLQLCSIGAS